jgi:predicted nucleic acid-binding Zn ribbon protein
MAKDRNSMTPLKDILADLLHSKRLPFNVADGAIWEIWDDVVGQNISNHARPSWIRDGILRVMVSDPIWLQELQFVEAQIRDTLNKRLGREAVKKIQFRIGPYEPG